MSRIYFADELAIDRTIAEHRGALERIQAFRVIVPEITALPKLPKPAFSFWLSPATEGLGQLCLMEGNGSDASNPFNYAVASTYTTLQSLVHFARAQRRIGVLSLHIPNEAHSNSHALVNDTHPPSLVHQFHNVEPFVYDFFKDPEQVLQNWGCEISPLVKIDALYQVREYGPEAATGWKVASMFAYALAVERVP